MLPFISSYERDASHLMKDMTRFQLELGIYCHSKKGII